MLMDVTITWKISLKKKDTESGNRESKKILISKFVYASKTQGLSDAWKYIPGPKKRDSQL